MWIWYHKLSHAYQMWEGVFLSTNTLTSTVPKLQRWMCGRVGGRVELSIDKLVLWMDRWIGGSMES
jgi:hypothetical protein